MSTHRLDTFHVDRTIGVWPNVSVAPAQEPIPLEEFKAHARVVDAEEDALLAGYVMAARKVIERRTHRALITQTWTASIDRFPLSQDGMIELPGGKLQSVTSISYVDLAGATQTWSSSEYTVHTEFDPGRIGLAHNEDWPAVREWGLPITITYIVGYGDDPADVPEDLRMAILMLALELAERRHDTDTEVSLDMVPWGVVALSSSYEVRRL